MKSFHSRDLLAKTPIPIAYIVDGILPETLTPCDISGPPGSGKSTIALSMVEHISTGKDWFGQHVKQRSVAWIAGEASDEGAMARDLHRLNADPECDILVIFPETEMFRWNKRIALWEVIGNGSGIAAALTQKQREKAYTAVSGKQKFSKSVGEMARKSGLEVRNG
jgi:hypothetical protein